MAWSIVYADPTESILSWSAVGAATTYYLYYGTPAGPPYNQAYGSGIDLGNVLSYDAAQLGLSAGAYHWAVTALVDGEETAWSTDDTFVV